MHSAQSEKQDSAIAISRRTAIASIGALGAGVVGAQSIAQNADHGLTRGQLGWDESAGEYTLPELPYAYDALEPHIDEETMRIHHDRHHAGYVRGLNGALAALAKIRDGEGDASLTQHWTKKLAFHGSGHINHTLFWLTMSPTGGGEPGGALAEAITRDFGSFSGFSNQFQAAARSVEGSGWAWLVVEHVADRLMILVAENQQKMASMGVTPIVGVDVWEHAYYLKYQNRRGDYVAAFMNVIDWDRAGSLFEHATG